jgi:hypothetical protein
MIFFATKITNKIYIHSSIIETKSTTVLVPWIFTLSRTRTEKTISGIYHDMHGLTYTSWWTLIVDVPLVKYVKLQRMRNHARNMGCSHPKISESDPQLLGSSWVCVDLLVPFFSIQDLFHNLVGAFLQPQLIFLYFAILWELSMHMLYNRNHIL